MSVNLIDIVDAIPEDEKRAIYKKLGKSLGVRQREKILVTRHEIIVKSGKVISLLDGYNVAEMKEVLQLAMDTVTEFADRKKNPGRNDE